VIVRRAFLLVVAVLAVVAAAAVTAGTIGGAPSTALGAGVKVPAGAPLPMLQDIDPEDLDPSRDVPGLPPIAMAPPGGAVIQPGLIRIPKPSMPSGPRRIGLQAGHWKTDEVPAELGKRITTQTGTTSAGTKEVDVNLDIAQRVRAQLVARGFVVDIIPTTVPLGYLADVFIALHADGDGTGENSGFKMAHAARRGPYEDRLVALLREEYAKATSMSYDGEHVGRNMQAYYAFNWGRYQHTAAAHTPAAILEMGYLSNDDDRAMLTDKADRVATGITNGVVRFLAEVPQSKIFGEDIVVPSAPSRPSPSPSG
jgi:N-acetylmuramoyl-L-alanine amidase